MKIKEFKETIKLLKKQLKSLNIKVSTPKRLEVDNLIVYRVEIQSPKNYLITNDGVPSTFIREYDFTLKALTKEAIFKMFEDTVSTIGNSFIYISEEDLVDKN